MIFEEQKRLGAFLCFDREAAEADNDPYRVIKTMAFMLSHFDSHIHHAVVGAIHGNLTALQLDVQFQVLLRNPLLSAIGEGPIVILIDGLDECGSDDPRSQKYNRAQLLDIVVEMAKLPHNIRIIITSRDSSDIRMAMNRIPRSSKEELELRIGEEGSSDISIYVQQRMLEVAQCHQLPEDWLDVAKQQALVNHAEGLFKWAQTACDMIKAAEFPDQHPEEVLDSLIGGTGHCSLDDLYDKALHSSLDRHWLKPDFAQAFNDVLGLVLAAKLPISAIAIDQFLGGRRRARGVLSPMRHLLQYSHVDEDEPVQLLHTSFRDFISNTSRSDMPWFVDVERHNYRFALRCMGILHPHPCLPAQHRGEPSLGLTMLKVEAKEYACTQWILHVCDMVTCPAGFERTLQQWLETYMIAWLEDMSELGKSGNILDLLEQLLRWVKVIS